MRQTLSYKLSLNSYSNPAWKVLLLFYFYWCENGSLKELFAQCQKAPLCLSRDSNLRHSDLKSNATTTPNNRYGELPCGEEPSQSSYSWAPWYLESPTSFQLGAYVILSEERGEAQGWVERIQEDKSKWENTHKAPKGWIQERVKGGKSSRKMFLLFLSHFPDDASPRMAVNAYKWI